MPSWRRVFTSEEARIESLAGNAPPLWSNRSTQFPCQRIAVSVWPMPAPPPFPADDEDDEAPDA